MLYIVQCEVTERKYMRDWNEEPFSKVHLVEAESEEQAMQKVKKYYDDKEDTYYNSYYVDIIDCSEIIK
jgi:hypothetical protein